MSIPQLPPTPPCQEWDPRVPNPFGYQPSLGVGIVFTVIFAASTFCHAWQAWRFRKPWLIFFVLGGVGEVSGWLSRTLAWECPYSVDVFKAQLVSLMMGTASFPLLYMRANSTSASVHHRWNLRCPRVYASSSSSTSFLLPPTKSLYHHVSTSRLLLASPSSHWRRPSWSRILGTRRHKHWHDHHDLRDRIPTRFHRHLQLPLRVHRLFQGS